MSDTDKKNDVTVYSTTWCGFCRMAKTYLKSLDVPFKEVDVEQDPEGARFIVEKTNQRGVPVIQIGERIILGFDRPAIDDALKASHLVK